ncbi:hypothetical protein [Alteromonas sediminis]|nr:hypothetical protein [Alteromonas sediminis]
MGNLSPCVPYWSECHSISATGRQYPEFFVFKALMIPTAVCMAMYWLLLDIWLRQISKRVSAKWVTAQGLMACVALIVYTVTLGAEGEPYKLARRVGIVFFFVFTSFAHLLLLAKLTTLDTKRLGLTTWCKRMHRVCFVLVASSIISAILGYVFPNVWDRWDNAFEWSYSLLMISLFYIVGKMWQTTTFSVCFTTKNESP